MMFVPTSGDTTARNLSAALWRLSRPSQGADTTADMFESVTMLDNTVWLAVDTTFTIPVAADAILDGIADVLQPWVNEGALPANTIPDLTTFVETSRGGTMIPWDAFPQLFKDQAKTRAQLETEGLLSATP